MSDEQMVENTQNIPDNAASEELTEDELNQIAGGGKLDGISYLVAVTQMKANSANDDALDRS